MLAGPHHCSAHAHQEASSGCSTCSVPFGGHVIRFAGFVVLLLTAVAAVAGDVPKLRYRADTAVNAPLWVPVELAFGAGGRLKPSLFPGATDPLALRSGVGANAPDDTAREGLEFLGNEECTTAWGGTIGGSKPARDLSELLEHAVAVHHGRVTDISYGFYAGAPGALLRADLIAAPRPGGVNTDDGLLVFYNYARFQSGGTKYCAGFREPAIGEEFIVFAYDPPADSDRSIIDANNRIFFRTHGGNLESTPGWTRRMRLGNATITSFDELRRAAATDTPDLASRRAR